MRPMRIRSQHIQSQRGTAHIIVDKSHGTAGWKTAFQSVDDALYLHLTDKNSWELMKNAVTQA